MSERHRYTFGYHIPKFVIQLGGFNHWEISLLMDTYNGLASVRIGKVVGGGIENRHIVVVEDVRESRTRRRTDWYFGIFDLPRDKFCPDIVEIKKLVSRKNRVAGRELSNLILHAAEEVWDRDY